MRVVRRVVMMGDGVGDGGMRECFSSLFGSGFWQWRMRGRMAG